MRQRLVMQMRAVAAFLKKQQTSAGDVEVCCDNCSDAETYLSNGQN